MTGSNMFSQHTNDLFKQYTHSAYIAEGEIDALMLDKIKKDYDIQLINDKPFHSGMIAVVYLGIMNNKKVIVKIKRKNITSRVKDGCSNVIFIYNILKHISWMNESLKEILLSIKVIEQTTEYLISQCNFEHEIEVMTTTQNEIREQEMLNNVMVPTVYNKPDDIPSTNFILMEYFDGVFSNDLNDLEERTQYLKELLTYGILSTWVLTYYHTDLHSGNIIYMKENGILKVGIIDFGMVLKMSDTGKEFLKSFAEITNGVPKDNSIQIISTLLNINIDKNKLKAEEIQQIDDVYKKLALMISAGQGTDKEVFKIVEQLKSILKIKVKISLELFLIIISVSMANSTVVQLSKGDLKLVEETSKKVVSEILD
jgi:predicted unusual protein kinase regulating ubiquinone biosynthesis (AarF/ABC1/UbiB family)